MLMNSQAVTGSCRTACSKACCTLFVAALLLLSQSRAPPEQEYNLEGAEVDSMCADCTLLQEQAVEW